MPDLPLLDVPLNAAEKLPPYELFHLGGEGGGESLKIALLGASHPPSRPLHSTHPPTHLLTGLLTDDPSLYRPNSFGEAPILPLLPTATHLRTQLYEEENVDCVLALTHQVSKKRSISSSSSHPPTYLPTYPVSFPS